MPIITDPTPQQILDLEIGDNDSGASTVRGYLVALLRVLWVEEEGFSGKRPFGNSGWQHADCAEAFVRAGFVDGVIHEPTEDEDWTEVEEYDVQQLDALVLSAIKALGEVTA